MQRCTATIRLAGDMLNTVQKSGLSPAEIIILRHIHGGPDAVVDIQPNYMDKSTHMGEYDRLCSIYRADVVATIFPGAMPRLPVSLKEIMADAPDEEEEAPAEEDEAADTDQDADKLIKAVDEMPPVETLSDELDVDDKELVDRIMAAGSKKELSELAEENEVDLTGHMAGKMDAIKEYIVKSLFPNYQF